MLTEVVANLATRTGSPVTMLPGWTITGSPALISIKPLPDHQPA